MKIQYAYIMQLGEEPIIKIGVSEQPEYRLKTLRRKAGSQLELRYVYLHPSRSHVQAYDNWAYIYLPHYEKSWDLPQITEWYALTPEDALQKLPQLTDPVFQSRWVKYQSVEHQIEESAFRRVGEILKAVDALHKSELVNQV